MNDTLYPSKLLKDMATMNKNPNAKPFDESSLDIYSGFYFLKTILSNHANIVAFNTIFLCAKVFDFFNKSKQMSMLSNTLYRAREDTLFFIIIFLVLMLGFVGMGYVSFG
jgi:Polycystin cation channel